MFFGPLPPFEAIGGVLAHRVEASGMVFKKGHQLTADDAAVMNIAGLANVTIARLDAGDIGEDAAAARVARIAAGQGVRAEAPFTGRVNLFATCDGVLVLDVAAITAFNRLDEGLTLATLPPFRRVVAGEMIATVKIIPFAIAGEIVAVGEASLREGAIAVHAFRPQRVGVLQLTLPMLKPSILTKTRDVTEKRVVSLSGNIAFEARVAHAEQALVEALRGLDTSTFDILLIFGAAAITDRRDVIPAGLVAAGGTIEHLGMPVDPGNLLMLGAFHGKPVIGAPGCARSPAENGFDWVLERLFAGLPVKRSDVQAMGVGGLLMEIVSRPQPRDGSA